MIVTDRNKGTNLYIERFNTTLRLIDSLPREVALIIFSQLNLSKLVEVRLVSKKWMEIASDPFPMKTVILRELAFGNAKWAKYGGKDVVAGEDMSEEFASLPFKEFIADCKNFKRIFPGIKAINTLMLVRLPKTLNGAFSLKNLGELANNYFPDSKTGYHFIGPKILTILEKRSIEKSYWVLMTKNLLPKSQDKYDRQKQFQIEKLVENNLMGYRIPETLEAVACLISQFFESKTALYSSEFTDTREHISVSISLRGIYLYNFGPNSRSGFAVLKSFEKKLEMNGLPKCGK